MQQQKIGIVLLIIGIIFLFLVTGLKIVDDKHIDTYVNDTGTCFTTQGDCLHDQQLSRLTFFIIGWILSGLLTLFGIHLAFIDKTQEQLFKHQELVSQALAKAQEQNTKKTQFEAFSAAFDSDKQKIIQIIHKEEGITQATLRFKANMTKSTLSQHLKELEEQEIILRKPKGKTKQIFIISKY